MPPKMRVLLDQVILSIKGFSSYRKRTKARKKLSLPWARCSHLAGPQRKPHTYREGAKELLSTQDSRIHLRHRQAVGEPALKPHSLLSN